MRQKLFQTQFWIPAILLLEYTNLRVFVIIGSVLNIVGAVMKCFANDPSLAWLTWLGQASCALAQPFLLGVPPRLAAIWFPSNEVSTATAMGVFGNQLGVAFGFIIPPLIVIGPGAVFNSNGSYPTDWSNLDRYPDQAAMAIEVVSDQLRILSVTIAIMSAVSFFSVIFLFQKEPLHPPSVAESCRRSGLENNGTVSPAHIYYSELRSLMSNRSFILLLISYGLNGGCYYTISALINQIIKPSLSQLKFTSAQLDATIGGMATEFTN